MFPPLNLAITILYDKKIVTLAMQLDRRLTAFLSAGILALLLLASLQAPIAQTTGAPVMTLGDSYALELGSFKSEYFTLSANTVNTTDGNALSGFNQETIRDITGDGSGEIFVVENMGTGLGGVMLGETTALPGSFYNYSATTWYNTTGEVFNDSFSDDLAGHSESFAENFFASYNSTYPILFEQALMDMVPIDIIPGIYSPNPVFDFSLGDFLLDANASMMPRESMLVRNVSIPINNQTIDVLGVESSFRYDFNFTNIYVRAEIPGTYDDWYLVNMTGTLNYDIGLYYNTSTQMLEGYYEAYGLYYSFNGYSTLPPFSAPQLFATGDHETTIVMSFSKSFALNANVTQANFGPGNPTPSIDPAYPFNYSDRVVYDVSDYTYGYVNSFIKDSTGNDLDAMIADYSELGLGEMELFFAYTDPGISLNSRLSQSSSGLATYGLIYTGTRNINSAESHGYLNGSSLIWENGTMMSENFYEFKYDKLVIPYNSTHPMIGEYRPYVDFFEIFQPESPVAFLDFIDNGTLPLTSLTSHTYNLYLNVNNNTNYNLNALEFIGVYDRNWSTSVVNYEIPGINGNFNLTISIYFWYAEYYTYDTQEGILLMADNFANLDIAVSGPGLIWLPGQSTATPVTLNYTNTINYELTRTLTTIPYFYPYTPPPSNTTTTFTNTTTTNTATTTAANNTNTTAPSPTPTTPAAPTFLPGFELYVSAAAIFAPVVITLLRRNK